MNAPAISTALITGFLLLLGALGCRSPQVAFVYHQLHPLAVAATEAHPALQVEVLPVRLPGLLRRPQLVLAGPEISDAHRWANGLDHDVQRVLVENLSLLLGSESVVAYPDGDRLKGAFHLSLEVDQWESRAGSLAFRGTWMVRAVGREEPVCIRKARIDEPLKDGSPEALVAAQERILFLLSSEMAAELGRMK